MQLELNHLDELRGVDIATVDTSKLADVNTIKLDAALSKEERAAHILQQTPNPYCFRCGEIGVKIEFADSGPTLQDIVTKFLLRQKSGI